jgi:hypothetical protein
MKQEASFFEGHEPVLIYIAKQLKDALRLESILTDSGFDYGVEADEYRSGVVFRTVRAGAFFYVLPGTADAARELLRRNGYKPYDGLLTGIPDA